MLTIRLQRIGKKHQPSFRVVVSERRSKLGGPPIEDLGFYNPFSKQGSLNKERVLYWIKTGAHPTATVHNLCVKKGVLESPKRAIKMKKRKAGESAPAVPASVVTLAASVEASPESASPAPIAATAAGS